MKKNNKTDINYIGDIVKNLFDFNAYKTSTNNKYKSKILISVLGFVAIIILALYITNSDFREFFDRNLLAKEISDTNSTSIDLEEDANQFVYAYDKYIVILNRGLLSSYNSSGSKVFESELSIGNPVFASNNRFLCVGEQNGSKICLISGKNILWQNDIDGQISKINVNKNGYVSVIITGTSYKTVIATYNASGKELFKTYLSSTTAVSTDISHDNKYLAIAELDSSGALVKSDVKIISITKAESDPSNSIDYTHFADSGQLIINVKYQDKGILSCLYNDSIHVIQNKVDTVFMETTKKSVYYDINLKNNAVIASEKNDGLFSSSTEFIIKNIQNRTENIYQTNDLLKDLYTYNEHIAINLGTQVHFITNNGWLIKKYSSKQEITNIVLGDSIAGIVYRSKVDIIDL